MIEGTEIKMYFSFILSQTDKQTDTDNSQKKTLD